MKHTRRKLFRGMKKVIWHRKLYFVNSCKFICGRENQRIINQVWNPISLMKLALTIKKCLNLKELNKGWNESVPFLGKLILKNSNLKYSQRNMVEMERLIFLTSTSNVCNLYYLTKANIFTVVCQNNVCQKREIPKPVYFSVTIFKAVFRSILTTFWCIY